MRKDIAQKTEEFFSHFPLKVYKKGQILIYAGDEPPGMFCLTKGEIRQYTITNRGNELVVNVLKPADFFPISWAINKTTNEFFYETATDSSVRLIPVEKALEFIKNDSEVMMDLLSRVSSGVESVFRRLNYAMRGSAKLMIIHELVIECRRFGKSQNNCVIIMPEKEIAARTGLSRETVSRVLHKLHTEGVVNVRYKHVNVRDIKRLEKELQIGL